MTLGGKIATQVGNTTVISQFGGQRAPICGYAPAIPADIERHGHKLRRPDWLARRTALDVLAMTKTAILDGMKRLAKDRPVGVEGGIGRTWGGAK